MSYEALFNRLAGARGKDIPRVTIDSISRLFDEMGEKQAASIVSLIEEYENVPSNLYGVIKKIWVGRKAQIENERLWKDHWTTSNEDCTTPEEWKAFFAIISEILLWHKLNLVKTNPIGVTTACTILEWKKYGCPDTWSPILDHFLTGYIAAHSLSGNGCLDYLNKYLQKLQEARKTKQEKNLYKN